MKKYEASKSSAEENKDEGEGDSLPATRSRQDVKDTLIFCLEQVTLFESYNQINFNEAPEKIIHMAKGFIHLGGYTNINIGFDTLDHKEIDKYDIAEIKRLAVITEEYKESKDKFTKRLLLSEFLATFTNYNDISYELIDVDSPLKWIIDCPGTNYLNFFEH